jgi:hypothetical protein
VIGERARDALATSLARAGAWHFASDPRSLPTRGHSPPVGSWERLTAGAETLAVPGKFATRANLD